MFLEKIQKAGIILLNELTLNNIMNFMRNRFVKVILFNIIYLTFVLMLTGIKTEYLIVSLMCSFLYLFDEKTKKFILAFGIFVVFGVIYDLMKIYPNYKVNDVDISSLYHFEKRVFGFTINNKVITPNEFFAIHHNSFFDLISGFFYINWMPVPIAFAIWLYIKYKQQFLTFSLTFLFVNLIGFCIYYIHPAAPPWYVAKYSFDFHMGIGGETAGLGRFDELLGIKIFGALYSRNSNVFAAMPSLHCAYPVVVLYYAVQSKVGWIKYILVLFMIGIWFSAVYSGHHYITDVIAGILCAGIGILIFQKILLNMSIFHNWILNYTHLIT